MQLFKSLLFCIAATFCIGLRLGVAEQPNILWVLTDDQRCDSIQAFNRMLHGQDHSELGYVESPNIDRLARQGTTFINTFCHAQGCAPSRASMHYGRYPHHTGIYEFEYHNDSLPHWRPSLPEAMKAIGYQTFHVGKLGVRQRSLQNGRLRKANLYDQDLNFHKMHAEGLTDWTKGSVTKVNGVELDQPTHADWMVSVDGKFEYTGLGLNDIPGLENQSQSIDEKYNLLRMYSRPDKKAYGSGEIIGGVSPQPSDKTRDGHYANQLRSFLKNPNQPLSVGSQKYRGVDPSRPLFAHIGFDFPHTPVLPPKEFYDRFQQHSYKVPEFDQKEFDRLPAQLQKLVKGWKSEHFSADEKQQMVRDYYAFCAYGDTLVGQAADDFIEYSQSQGQPWMIIYVCGDHGWKLNEHGAISKFSPWKVDSNNPIIVVSSDKKAFPAGNVVTELTEFVDIMPTAIAAGGGDLSSETYRFLDGYDLARVASKDLPGRPYVISESHAVTGARATIRTKDFMFSVKSRPNGKHGKNFEWALNADYKDLEPLLYDQNQDPDEIENLAFDPKYKPVVEALKQKLLNIVLGDGRVEVEWKKPGNGTEYFSSNFAPGADDKQLEIKF